MRNTFRILALLLVLFLLTSCGALRKAVNYETDTPSGLLSIYCFVNGAGVPMYREVIADFQKQFPDLDVTVTTFTDAQKLNEQLVTDQENGTMPDVLFLSCYAGLNWAKLMDSGVFMDLSTLLQDDPSYETVQLLNGVEEACVYKDGQYLLPFTLSVPYLFSSNERVEAYCPALLDAVSAGDRIKAVLDLLYTGTDSPVYPLIMTPGDYDLFNWCDALGTPIVDFENQTVSGQEALDSIRPVVHLLNQINRNSSMAWSDPVFRSVSNVFSGTVMEENAVFLYSPLYHNVSSMKLIDAAYRIIDETMTLIPFPQYDDASAYGATIVSCGGITTSSQNVEGGYFFLRYMMEHADALGYGLPVQETVLTELAGIDQPWAAQLHEVLSSLSFVRVYTPGGPQWSIVPVLEGWPTESENADFAALWAEAQTILHQELFE